MGDRGIFSALIAWLLRSGMVRLMAALGIAFVSYGGIGGLFDVAVGYVTANLVSGVPELTLTMMSIFGVFDALAVLLGGMQALLVIKAASPLLTRTLLRGA